MFGEVNTTRQQLWLAGGVVAAVVAAAAWCAASRCHTTSTDRLPATLEEFKQKPGGRFTVEAGEFLVGLAKAEKLPGFSAGDHGAMQARAPEAKDEPYPVTRAVHFTKDGDTSDYLYVVVRGSPSAS